MIAISKHNESTSLFACPPSGLLDILVDFSSPPTQSRTVELLTCQLSAALNSFGYIVHTCQNLAETEEDQTMYFSEEPSPGTVAHERFHSEVFRRVGDVHRRILSLEEAFAYVVDDLEEEGLEHCKETAQERYKLLRSYRQFLKAMDRGVTAKDRARIQRRFEDIENQAGFLALVYDQGLYSLCLDLILDRTLLRAKPLMFQSLSIARRRPRDVNSGIDFLVQHLDGRRKRKYETRFNPPITGNLGQPSTLAIRTQGTLDIRAYASTTKMRAYVRHLMKTSFRKLSEEYQIKLAA